MSKIKTVKEKILRAPVEPRKEGFLPLLLCTVSMAIALLAVIIDKFIYRFGGELLAPMLSQLIILLIPAYMFTLIILPEGSTASKLRSLGISRLRAEYVFFMIFTALFMISTSLVMNIIFGGVYTASEGFTLLGAFTAGVGEYTVSYPYLIIVYAAIPAIVEEIVFRGLLYTTLSKVSEGVAVCLSSIISAAFTFSIGGFPAALFCSLTYCFVRHTTRSLQSCMIVHFIFNLYAIFAQTNLSKYFLSSQNLVLLIIVVVAALLVSAALFFSETARVYRGFAKKIKEGEETSGLSAPDFKKLLEDGRSVLLYRPTLICTVVFLASFLAITVIRLLS